MNCTLASSTQVTSTSTTAITPDQELEHGQWEVTTDTQIGRLVEFYSTETAKVLKQWWWWYGGRILTHMLLTQFKELNLRIRKGKRRLPGELGVSNSMECDIFPSVLWHCWSNNRKGIRPVKKLDVGLLVVMIWLELCTTYSSSCQFFCHHHLHHPLLQ